MKNRNIKELLIIIRRELIEDKAFHCGICFLLVQCEAKGVISEDEKYLLEDFISFNRPHYKNNPIYGWREGAKSPRLKWLTKEIEKR
jgi:hypothetical protein